VVKLLLEAKANVKAGDLNGQTPLSLARRVDNVVGLPARTSIRVDAYYNFVYPIGIYRRNDRGDQESTVRWGE
jgi:hypothetical protein